MFTILFQKSIRSKFSPNNAIIFTKQEKIKKSNSIKNFYEP